MEMKPAGRRRGQLVNKRDARGWAIPRSGTKRRGVYDGLVRGLSVSEIAEGLDISPDAVWSHKEYIAGWRRVHERRRAYELRECEG